MKKTNKGFSLVELIIVIAIMAILAGALAPALVKYINKSRLAGDIQTAQTVATAVNAAMANPTAYDELVAKGAITASDIAALNVGTNFDAEVNSALGKNKSTLKIKSSKDMDKKSFGSSNFLVTIDAVDNEVKVYVGDTNHEAYPNPVKSLSEKENKSN